MNEWLMGGIAALLCWAGLVSAKGVIEGTVWAALSFCLGVVTAWVWHQIKYG